MTLPTRVVVCGSGGFIGSHMVKYLKNKGYNVLGVDLKPPQFDATAADEFRIADLRDYKTCLDIVDGRQHVYQFAANMGGIPYILSGDNDAQIMSDNLQINLNIARACHEKSVSRMLFSSSACIYDQSKQTTSETIPLIESDAYPANPDSEYGWEKLTSERIYLAYARNHGLDIRLVRYHNIFGPLGTYRGGREKVIAALCRKIAAAKINNLDSIEVIGDGKQTRTFCYIDDCVRATYDVMQKNYQHPINIGSSELISINDLARMIMLIANYPCSVVHVDGPTGVRGRSSDNALLKNVIGWEPNTPLRVGVDQTYKWIEKMVEQDFGK